MKNKVYITDEQLDAIQNEYNKHTGSNAKDPWDWMKYRGAWYFKNSRGKWVFSGYGLPSCRGYFKTVGDVLYIYTEDNENRCEISKACQELLGLTA